MTEDPSFTFYYFFIYLFIFIKRAKRSLNQNTKKNYMCYNQII